MGRQARLLTLPISLTTIVSMALWFSANGVRIPQRTAPKTMPPGSLEPWSGEPGPYANASASGGFSPPPGPSDRVLVSETPSDDGHPWRIIDFSTQGAGDSIQGIAAAEIRLLMDHRVFSIGDAWTDVVD